MTRSPAQTSFNTIEQPWLRAAVKRWARLRLGSGKTYRSVHVDVRAMLWFSRFLTQRDPRALRRKTVVTRDALESIWCGSPAHISLLTPPAPTSPVYESFSTPADATAGCRDCPRPQRSITTTCPADPGPCPGFIPEFVMAQLEDPEHLAMLPDATTRALVIVITETGLRGPNDACSLPFNPIIDHSARWRCLRYFNTKMAAEQLVPLSATAAEAIRAQQRHLLHRWPDGLAGAVPRPAIQPPTRPGRSATPRCAGVWPAGNTTSTCTTTPASPCGSPPTSSATPSAPG